MRKTLVFLSLAAIVIAIGFIFWYQEIKYSLPTPIPQNFRQVSLRSKISVAEENRIKPSSFLHFYNPDCPCSRFNAQHIRQLIRTRGDSIGFYIIVPSQEDIQPAKNTFGDNLNYLADVDGAIASSCGVYSTPQAVIIDSENRLFFRGNYNKSRYCTNQATNYAELALVSYLNKQSAPVFGLEASLAYGCELFDQTNSTIEIF